MRKKPVPPPSTSPPPRPTHAEPAPFPLTPAVLHILLALVDGERHGYAIAQEVEALTDGRTRMGPGTLYGTLGRMMGAGLIEETSPRRKAGREEDSRRRYYQLAGLGRVRLASETERLARVVAVARAKNLIRGPEPA